MVEKEEICLDRFFVQEELICLLVSLGVQCSLALPGDVDLEMVKLHWLVFDQVAVWSPYASTRREAIWLIWKTNVRNDAVRVLWRQRHRAAWRRAAFRGIEENNRRKAGLGSGCGPGLVAYLRDEELMYMNDSIFPLEVLYADHAILRDDVEWFDDGPLLQNCSVGKYFEYSGRMSETLVLEAVFYLHSHLEDVPQFWLVVCICLQYVVVSCLWSVWIV